MKMRRIIHNVGCGNFCTETFFYSLPNKGYFNMVYDCGSSDMKDPVNNEASRHFSHYGNIDLLFISHFDDDHISGIKALQKYMDRNTKVILPYFTDCYRLLSGKKYYHNYFDLVDYYRKNEIPICYVNAESEGSEERRVNVNQIDWEGNYSSGTIFYLETRCGVWEYIPFNIQETIDFGLVKQVCREKGMSEDDINDCINHRTFNEKIQNKLKEVYKDPRISRTYSGVTNANMVSLLLISKEADTVEIISSVVKGWHTDVNYSEVNLRYSSEEYFLNNASCLYTGDAGLQKKTFFDVVLKYYKRYLHKGVGILQMPHHGTVKYYPQNVHAEISMEAGFTNITIGSQNPLLYAQIPFDFAYHHTPFYLVTDKSYSRLVNDVHLVCR